MNPKPILFNTEMNTEVRAGRKTATRRCVKYRSKDGLRPVPTDAKFVGVKVGKFTWETEDSIFSVKAPYQAGDILYVRETFAKLFYVDPDGYTHFDKPMYYYAADGAPGIVLVDADGFEEDDQKIRWRPSIHMPKEAARTFLKVTDVRVEHLQDIFLDPPGPNNQVVKEGCRYGGDFIAVWQNTCKKEDLPLYGYDANPWVWVIEFQKTDKPFF